MFGFPSFMRQRCCPESDPSIPPKDECLGCGKTADPQQPRKMPRCSKCKLARVCDQECMKKGWQKGHKENCDKLAKFQGANKLPHIIEVQRSFHGAIILNPRNLVPSEFSSLRSFCRFDVDEMLTILLSTHPRLGRASPARKIDSRQIWEHIFAYVRVKWPFHTFCSEEECEDVCVCVKAGRPCRGQCDYQCHVKNPLNKFRKKSEQLLSPCAADHLSIVKSLTKDQLNARYTAACAERWGNERAHRWVGDDEEGIPLKALLSASSEECEDCGADGEQFFSFCLNRPVNADRVHHCEYCGKCFYFRPGCMMGCAHCGYGMYTQGYEQNFRQLAAFTGTNIQVAREMLQEHGTGFSDEFVINFVPSARGCSVPAEADRETRGLASEGYWGY